MEQAEYDYDGQAGGNLLPGVPNAIGRLSAVSNDIDAASFFAYDQMGRVIERVSATLSGQYPTSAAYDLAGNMTDLTYPDGHHVQQTWDTAGRLATVNQSATSGVAAASYLQQGVYFPDGSPYITTLGNGVQQTIAKNNRLQVQSMTVASPLDPFQNQPFLSHTYCYVGCSAGQTANNGNIWQIADLLNGAKTQGFTYDALNRIQSFSLGGVLAQQYQIDSFGNMAQTLGGGFVPSFTPASGQAATNQITNLPCASTTPSGTGYDSGGNQLCSTDQYGGISQYTYDGENRISQISALNSSASPFVSYTYGGDGARTRKTLDSTHFTDYVEFNGAPIAERDQDGNWTDYIYANGKKIARVAQAVPMLHFYGSNPQATVECGAAIGPSNLNYPVQYGDKLSWREYKNNAVGGMMQWFDNNTIGDQWQATDTNGHTVNQDTRQNQWVTRTFDMSSYAGHSLSSLAVLKDVETPAGAWDIWYSDIAILSLNGSVTSVFGSDGVGSIAGAECQGPGVAYGEVQSIGTAPGIPGSGVDTHFYLGDHLGTAQMEFSSGGWPVWQGQFAPYGQEIPNGTLLPPDQPDGTANHYKFTGKERDAESGLDYFGARYYASSMGRFMSADPVQLSKKHLAYPQRWNAYAYVRNNPLSLIDPDGEEDRPYYVFLPLGSSKQARQSWQSLQNYVNRPGSPDHMTIYYGKQATASAWGAANADKDSVRLFAGHSTETIDGHTLAATGIQLFANDGTKVNVGTGTFEGLTQVSPPPVSSGIDVILGCNSWSLASQFSNATFVGINPSLGADTAAEENGIMSFATTLTENGSLKQATANAQTSMQSTTTYDNQHNNGDFSKPTLTVKKPEQQQ